MSYPAWLCIPSARPSGGTIGKWKEKGYGVEIWRNPDDLQVEYEHYDKIIIAPYPGYAVACNALIKAAMEADPQCNWFVCAGDDTLPSERDPAEIASECTDYFSGVQFLAGEWERAYAGDTFGVMQPTGDRTFGDAQGPYIDRVAGSPWLGREFCRRMYGGNGPYWPEYTHQFVDQELQEVAIKYGLLWQRPDLTHFHDHWGRPRVGEPMGKASRMPSFLAEANSGPHWARAKAIFEARKLAGFPGSEPIA